MSKSLAPINNLSPFERLSTMMEDMFPTSTLLTGHWVPAVDIKETDKEFMFMAELPGMNRENLDVDLVGDTLVIRGKREDVKEEKGEGYLRKERHAGTFYRSFRLDAPVKENEIDAEYRDGILKVIVPKAEPVKTARINVK